MQYRRLGSSGLKVSAIGLGTNRFGGKVDLENTKNIIDAALDVGINLLDTADIYQEGRSEEFIGQALSGRRQDAIIATKVRHKFGEGVNDEGTSRQHILDGIHASLKRLQTDYIDLYQIHSWDDDTPIEETMRTLEDLVRSGKVRYIGASNFTAWQLTWANALAREKSWTSFVSIQPHYHLLHREIETELIPACQYFNIGILPYFPLAGGFLTGKYLPGQPPPSGSRGESSKYVQAYLTESNFKLLEKLEQFASQRGHSINDLAHAWLLAQPQVSSVISGATEVDHVLANAASIKWNLSNEETDTIRQMLEVVE
ncbi:MAG TPA: aldo/keto reductase [Anaerolineales bacterium]|nr:aldo/keto reductase [Anaerolineales bacterium]